MNKKASNKEMLDWTAVFIVVMAVGAIGLIVIFNHSLAIVLSPLLVLIPLYYLIRWAVIRTYRMWKESEADPVAGKVTKGVVAMLIALALPVTPAKAFEDDLAGSFAGIYSKMTPYWNTYWSVWWFNFKQTFDQSGMPTPFPWDYKGEGVDKNGNYPEKGRESGR